MIRKKNLNLKLIHSAQMLISHFTKSLNASAVDEFRTVSRLFRESCCNARAYYEHCEVVLGDRFENIFPELLVLLPDINKQQVSSMTFIVESVNKFTVFFFSFFRRNYWTFICRNMTMPKHDWSITFKCVICVDKCSNGAISMNTGNSTKKSKKITN